MTLSLKLLTGSTIDTALTKSIDETPSDSADTGMSVANTEELVDDILDNNVQPNLLAAQVNEPVSDSSLALVTAQERGVATDAISIPDFEDLVVEEAQTESIDEEEVAEAVNLAAESGVVEIQPESEDIEVVQEVQEVQEVLQQAQVAVSDDSIPDEPPVEGTTENADIGETEELITAFVQCCR